MALQLEALGQEEGLSSNHFMKSAVASACHDHWTMAVQLLEDDVKMDMVMWLDGEIVRYLLWPVPRPGGFSS